MPVSKVKETFRHEPSIDEADFSPAPSRKSGIVSVPKKKGKAQKPGKGKRSTKDMLASLATDPERAAYILERVAGYEDQIAKLFELCSENVRELVFKSRKSLRHYAPPEE